MVKPQYPQGEDVVRLSTLDQQAQRSYAYALLPLRLAPDSRVDAAVSSLKLGLSMALCEMPEMASTVVPLPGSSRNELELRIGPDSGVPLRVVDHDAMEQSPLKGLTFEELAEEKFPMDDLPRDALFVPHPTCEDPSPDGLPVLLLQLNLIEGGILIGLIWHHTACDARGVDLLLSAWARHTKTVTLRGTHDPDALEEPAEQVRERWRLEHGSRDITLDQFPDYIVDSAARSPLSPSSQHLLDRTDPVAVTARMSTWYFSDEALKAMRKALNGANTDEGAHITRSEAVSALLWKHVSQARQLPPQATSLFATRIDFRARFKSPFNDGFVGNINEPNARTRIPVREVCSASTPQSLATLALVIRDAITALDDKAVHDFIGLVDSLPAVTDLTWGYDTWPGPDLVVSDMSGMEALKQDWGTALGHLECMRSFSQEKGLAYVLPMDRDGGFEAQIQCDEEALERLKRDEVFTRYAQFLC